MSRAADGSLPDAQSEREAYRAAMVGNLVAWDPVAGREVWRSEHTQPLSGGTLSTAGNLVFQGTADGRFVAYRADDGRTLFVHNFMDRSVTVHDLSGLLEGEVRCDELTLQLYATDASIYQVTPHLVVVPKVREDVVAAVRLAAEHVEVVDVESGVLHGEVIDTQFYGAMQMPGKARLIVVKGDEAMGEGLSYLLQASEHVAGREADQIPFPSDNWLSPRHANFVYRGEKLVVRDEGSLNGII